MKRIVALALVAALSLCIAACSPRPESPNHNQSSMTSSDVLGASSYGFEEIPESYYQKAQHAGQLERIEYITHNQNGEEVRKGAVVYVPYGYTNQLNLDKPYNVVYLLPGVASDEETWFGTYGFKKAQFPLKNVLDHMIEDGKIEPMIVVSANYYTTMEKPVIDENFVEETDREDEEVWAFQDELINDLIPAVEGTYRTYAQTTDRAGLAASRNHRAIGGYSMGSVATWYAFAHNLDVYRYFMPMSMDSWELGPYGGENNPDATAAALAQAVDDQGFTPSDYFIYASVGDDGEAYWPMTRMMEGLESQPAYFVFANSTNDRGNIHFECVPGYEHSYGSGLQYVYNSLITFFK